MSKKIISTIKLIMCALKPICILLIQFNFFQERLGFHCKSEGGAGARSDRLKKKMNKCNEWKELFDIKGQSIDDYLRLALFENNFCSWNIFIEFHICFLGHILQYISIISPYLLCDIYFWGHICLFSVRFGRTKNYKKPNAAKNLPFVNLDVWTLGSTLSKDFVQVFCFQLRVIWILLEGRKFRSFLFTAF